MPPQPPPPLTREVRGLQGRCQASRSLLSRGCPHSGVNVYAPVALKGRPRCTVSKDSSILLTHYWCCQDGGRADYIICPFRCGAVVKLKDFNRHRLNRCGERVIKCPLPGCDSVSPTVTLV
jgi:hypothetical protein